MTPFIIPGPIERRKIAAEGPVTEKRVLRAYRDPSSVAPFTLARVTRAANALGLPAPSPVAQFCSSRTGKSLAISHR